MFNLGFSELIIIGVLALVFIGPKQLPEVARMIGRMLNELKRATGEFQSSVSKGVREDLDRVRNLEDNKKPADPHHEEPKA